MCGARLAGVPQAAPRMRDETNPISPNPIGITAFQARSSFRPRKAEEGRAQESRAVYFGGAGGMQDTIIYDRNGLNYGFKAAGPAVIEEYGSTTVVWPGDRFEVGRMGELRIYCGES